MAKRGYDLSLKNHDHQHELGGILEFVFSLQINLSVERVFFASFAFSKTLHTQNKKSRSSSGF
jgi:hypothetical protein